MGGLLRAEIEAHLEHLSEPAREVLSTASLVGPEFRVSSLAHVLEQSPTELLDSLQETEHSGLLKRTEIPGIFRFRQRLVQEFLSAEITGAHRARLHKRFGEAVEALHSNDDAFLEGMASHFYEAALLGCADKAANYCARAAALAYSNSKVDDAVRFYHMALEALEIQGTNANAIREVKANSDQLSLRQNHSSVPEPQSSEASTNNYQTPVAAPPFDGNGKQAIPSNSLSSQVELLSKTQETGSLPPVPPRPSETLGDWTC